MSTEPGPASRDLDRAFTSVIACAILGALSAFGEVAALLARHLMSPSNVLGQVAIGLAGPVAGLVIGVLSLASGGKKR